MSTNCLGFESETETSLLGNYIRVRDIFDLEFKGTEEKKGKYLSKRFNNIIYTMPRDPAFVDYALDMLNPDVPIVPDWELILIWESLAISNGYHPRHNFLSLRKSLELECLDYDKKYIYYLSKSYNKKYPILIKGETLLNQARYILAILNNIKDMIENL